MTAKNIFRMIVDRYIIPTRVYKGKE